MKNVQIIDGAENCSYSIYSISEESFRLLFPGQGQDVEFLDDAIARLGDAAVGNIMKETSSSRQLKAVVIGIHGTLFIGMPTRKSLYPNKAESDLDDGELQKAIARSKKTGRGTLS